MSAAAYTEPFDIGRVVVRAYDIIRRNLVLLTTLVLVLYGLPKLGATLVHGVTGDLNFPIFHAFFNMTAFAYGLVAFVGYLVFQAAAVYVTAADLNDRRPSFATAVRTGVHYIWPLLGILVVMVVGICVGTICLIVPGLFLATIWAVSVPAAVVERHQVGAALQRSAALTEGYRWPVFGIGIVYFIIERIFHAPFKHHGLFGEADNIIGAVGRTLTDLIGDGVSIVFALVGAVLITSVYYELRMLKENGGPELLAETLEP